jgi:integrase
MSVPAARLQLRDAIRPLPASTSIAPDALLAAYAEHVGGLAIGPDAKRIRRRAAERLLACHTNLAAWMTRPTPARLADLRRSGAWPFVTWCIVEGHLAADLDLLLAKTPGDLYAAWTARHPDDVARLAEVAARFGWSALWTRDLTSGGLALLCLWAGKTLAELGDDDFARFAAELATAPSATASARGHNQARLFSLHQACYELGICQTPPRQLRPPAASLAERLRAIVQPKLRRVALAYLQTVAATLRPATVELRADSLIVFSEYLAAHHPEVGCLADLDRQAHIEPFLAWNRGRPWRGRVARDRPVSLVVSKRVVVDLRGFFDDLAIWGWAERPHRRLLFVGDVPRLDRPLPRALSPEADRDLMAAVGRLDDLFARCGLTILRGTGMRLGELLDLELDCLWDSTSHGTWIKVPLGKLGTERMVPLDAETLAALDAWMTQRGPQRALPHPRDGRPADFLFMERGRRLSGYRLRRGLGQAAAAADLRGRDGAPLHVTPHQLRHTYGTALVNAGMSLQALMALLGHVSAEMTLRYASLASPTVRAAYEDAIAKVRARQLLPLIVDDKPTVPGRVEWLRGEMLKTRVAHGYCSRHLVAQACPYANVCEQCDNFVTTAEFLPALKAQLADVTALRDDAQARGWDAEVARHARVIASIEHHLRRLKNQGRSTALA